MLSPIYTYVFHVVSFLQVSQNPKCIALVPHVYHKPKCNFIHVHKKITKLTTAQHNYSYISCSKSDDKCQKDGQKKIQPLKSSMALTASSIFTKHTTTHHYYGNIFCKKLHPSRSTNMEILGGYSGTPARWTDLYEIHRCCTDFL